jgi:hypothetical protein
VSKAPRLAAARALTTPAGAGGTCPTCRHDPLQGPRTEPESVERILHGGVDAADAYASRAAAAPAEGSADADIPALPAQPGAAAPRAAAAPPAAGRAARAAPALRDTEGGAAAEPPEAGGAAGSARREAPLSTSGQLVWPIPPRRMSPVPDLQESRDPAGTSAATPPPPPPAAPIAATAPAATTPPPPPPPPARTAAASPLASAAPPAATAAVAAR